MYNSIDGLKARKKQIHIVFFFTLRNTPSLYIIIIKERVRGVEF